MEINKLNDKEDEWKYSLLISGIMAHCLSEKKEYWFSQSFVISLLKRIQTLDSTIDIYLKNLSEIKKMYEQFASEIEIAEFPLSQAVFKKEQEEGFTIIPLSPTQSATILFFLAKSLGVSSNTLLLSDLNTIYRAIQVLLPRLAVEGIMT